MELIKAVIEIYNAIPANFWHHFYSFCGSLLAVFYQISYVAPLNSIQIITNLMAGYFFGFLLAIPMTKVETGLAEVILKDAIDKELAENGTHFLVGLLGSSIGLRYWKTMKAKESEKTKPENPGT